MPDLIKSGVVWRALQFLQFSTQREAIHYYKEIDSIIDNCCLILTHCVAKASEKVESQDQIWTKFNEAIAKLLPKKILETLKMP